MDGSSLLDFHHHPIDLMILYDLTFLALYQIQNQNCHIHHQAETFSPGNSHFSQWTKKNKIKLVLAISNY
jgi:hypothetical protein